MPFLTKFGESVRASQESREGIDLTPRKIDQVSSAYRLSFYRMSPHFQIAIRTQEYFHSDFLKRWITVDSREWGQKIRRSLLKQIQRVKRKNLRCNVTTNMYKCIGHKKIHLFLLNQIVACNEHLFFIQFGCQLESSIVKMK